MRGRIEFLIRMLPLDVFPPRKRLTRRLISVRNDFDAYLGQRRFVHDIILSNIMKMGGCDEERDGILERVVFPFIGT